MNLINNYYDFTNDDIKYIPISIHDTMIIKLDSDTSDFSYKIGYSTKPPKEFPKVYSKKTSKLLDEYYNKKKEIKEIDENRIFNKIYDLQYLLQPVAVNITVGRFNPIIRKYKGKEIKSGRGYIWEAIENSSKQKITKFTGKIGKSYYIYFNYNLFPEKPIKALFIAFNLLLSPLEGFITYRIDILKIIY